MLSVYTFLKLDTEETACWEAKFWSTPFDSNAILARSSNTTSPDTAAAS